MTRTMLKPLVDEIQHKLTSSDPRFVVSIEEVPPLLEVYLMKGKTTLSNPTLLALIHQGPIVVYMCKIDQIFFLLKPEYMDSVHVVNHNEPKILIFSAV